MNKYKYILGIALLLGSLSVSAQVSNDNEDGVYKAERMSRRAFVPGEVLVKFKDASPVTVRRVKGKYQSVSQQRVNTVLQEFGANEMEQLLPKQNPKRQMRRAKAYNGETIVEKDLSQLYSVRINSQRPDSVRLLIDRLKALSEVEYAEPNYKAYIMGEPAEGDVICGNPSQNPLYSQQWGPAFAGVDKLWSKPIVNAKRPIIAILDTGVDISHPDLTENIWTNSAEAEGETGYDDDGDGFVDDVHGWDFVNNSPKMTDYNSHGTHVAGIAAAADNGIGIIGANPQAYIMPITVMQSDGSGDVRTIVKGIEYAAAHGATVINMSLGLATYSQVLREALGYAYQTAVLVAAAGNDEAIIYPEEDGKIVYPAAHSFVLGVMATKENGELAKFSNYDPDGPIFSSHKDAIDVEGVNYELKAPGTNILSTVPGGNYKKRNGTSMATPLVSGAISTLMMLKDYANQEVLWGDLLHSDNNFESAYNITERPAEIDVVSLKWEDKDGNEVKTEELSAGGTYKMYPTLRTTWGEAKSVKMNLSLAENEDGSLVDVIANDVNLGSTLHPYAYGISENPIVITLSPECVDGRHISMVLNISCDGLEAPKTISFSLIATNTIRISGLIKKDMVLSANHTYYVDDNIGVMSGVTLTIEPGARLEFAKGKGIICDGALKAHGTKERPIIFTSRQEGDEWGRIIVKNRGAIIGKFYTNGGRSVIGISKTTDTPIEITKLYLKSEYQFKPISFDSCLDLLYNLIQGGKECSWEETEEHTVEFIPSRKEYVRDTLSYCQVSYLNLVPTGGDELFPYMKDCILKGCRGSSSGMAGEYCTFTSGETTFSDNFNCINFNYANNIFARPQVSSGFDSFYQIKYLNHSNVIENLSRTEECFVLGYKSDIPMVQGSLTSSYLGSSREDLIRPHIWEIGYGEGTYGTIDLSNMLTEPVKEAHGIVWKVVVNGYDAQDEYEQLPPLGVGKHKFEVYFNRPMNKTVAPKVSFGVRSPYTQHAVNEDGSWNDEGTIYTVYATITGKTQSDGVNRIYVYGAEDNEFFECPYENTRFNINIQAVGSLASGFVAKPKMGKVELEWNNENNDFTDAIGFNVYRIGNFHEESFPVYNEYGSQEYGYDENGNWGPKTELRMVADTIRINQIIIDIEATTYTDYDVVPGETYYYYYKVLSTDLKEYDVSNMVAATPLSSVLGDANGSGEVDVADVITTVGYITEQNPQPFIFEAADINADQQVDVVDVIGIVQVILNPNAGSRAFVESSATYTVEDGILYVESPIALAGVQAQLTLDGRGEKEDIKVSSDLTGFEHASAWLSDNDYLFLAYNMTGKMLEAGKHAVLYIGDAEVNTLRLSDAYGHNVTAIAGNTTAINRMGSDVMNVKGIYTLGGQKLSGNANDLRKLPKGVYIINGEKVVK